jgi:hypothetical protein
LGGLLGDLVMFDGLVEDIEIPFGCGVVCAMSDGCCCGVGLAGGRYESLC